MFKGKKILALVPARGGSKGLPNKNIIPLAGEPLIAWTLELAIENKFIDKVIVSTDDDYTAHISKEFGAEVPFIRPKKLAKDTSSGIDVVLHTIQYFKNKNELYDLLFLLQPTSPLRNFEDINCALNQLFLKKAQAIVSVCEVEHHPYWANILPDDFCMNSFLKKVILNKNRQDLPKFYRLNGAIFFGYWDYIIKENGFFGDKTFAYIMPRERSIDIDNIIDFKLAEMMLK